MKISALALLLLLFFNAKTHAQTVETSSPDGKIVFKTEIHNGKLLYSVSYGQQVLVEKSPLEISFSDGIFGKNVRLISKSNKKITENYELTSGKASNIRSESNETVLALEENTAPKIHIDLVVRVFNDGAAFRYDFPKQRNLTKFIITDENTTFNIAGNPKIIALPLAGFENSHEGLYDHSDFKNLKEKQLYDMPALFQFGSGSFLAITEAAVRNYAGMSLWKEDGTLRGKLSPKIGDENVKVEANFPHQSPWRVFMIADDVGKLHESNILTNLNEPNKIGDTSWLKPGKTTFTWWNGFMLPNLDFQPGINFPSNKYYIDFAAENGIQYHSIYGYGEQAWYTDDSFDFGTPGKNADITKPVKSLDMQKICDYAKSKGVGIHVWTNWKALYAKLDEALPLFEKWGVKGMMVDFMNRDDQEMINIQEEILAKAAKHHIFVQFHGSSKPSGLNRTYPNEFTREGTLNYENYKWSTNINADHDLDIAFTRLLAGATDYHLGGFRAVPYDKFKPQFTNPLVTSSRSHMLAMYVVLESYLNMVCDTPNSYKDQPGFDFIKNVPNTWDETKTLSASVGNDLVIARRKGRNWYVGGINNSTEKTLEIPLKFLPKGNFKVKIYRDAEDSYENPNHIITEEKVLQNSDSLKIKMAKDGGFALEVLAQ